AVGWQLPHRVATVVGGDGRVPGGAVAGEVLEREEAAVRLRVAHQRLGDRALVVAVPTLLGQQLEGLRQRRVAEDLALARGPTTCLVFGSHRIANRSPPSPFAVGSIRPRQAFIAIAASTALPPCLSISSPAWTASGWAAHTMPWAPYTTERVAAPRPAAPALA